jgi:hypothetical protein
LKDHLPFTEGRAWGRNLEVRFEEKLHSTLKKWKKWKIFSLKYDLISDLNWIKRWVILDWNESDLALRLMRSDSRILLKIRTAEIHAL